MSMSGLPSDPSQWPHPPVDSMSGATGAPRRLRPGGLNAVCVIAILLGSLGLGSSLLGLASLAAKPWLRKTFTMPQQQGMSDDIRDAQSVMQDTIEAVARRYQSYTLGLIAVNVVLAGSLLAGGIMALRLNPKARTLLVAVFAAAVVFEILRTVVQVFMQLEIAAAMSDSMPRMMEAAGPKGGAEAIQAAAFTATAVKVGVFLGIAFMLAFGLAKVIFYAVGACYLRRPSIRQLFER